MKLEKQLNDDLKSKVKFNWVNEPINFNFGLIEGGEWRSSVPTHCKMGIRISFDPDWEPKEVKKILAIFKDYPGYIFNLGHGITPDINPDNVKYLTELIRSI